MAHRPEVIANAFLGKDGALGRLTQMHIQKLVYLAHGWMLGLASEPLVDREPEAWERGPVFPSLRDHIKYAGKEPLRGLIRENDDCPFAYLGGGDRGEVITGHLTDYEKSIINHDWSKYGDKHAFWLSDLTHLPGTPWSRVYGSGEGRNDPIPNSLIRDHYSQLVNAALERAS